VSPVHTSGSKGRAGRRGGARRGAGRRQWTIQWQRGLSDMHSSGDGGEGDGGAVEAAAGWLCPSAKLWSLDSCWPTTMEGGRGSVHAAAASGWHRLCMSLNVSLCHSKLLAFWSFSAAPGRLLGPFSAPYHASTDWMMCGDATVFAQGQSGSALGREAPRPAAAAECLPARRAGRGIIALSNSARKTERL